MEANVKQRSGFLKDRWAYSVYLFDSNIVLKHGRHKLELLLSTHSLREVLHAFASCGSVACCHVTALDSNTNVQMVAHLRALKHSFPH